MIHARVIRFIKPFYGEKDAASVPLHNLIDKDNHIYSSWEEPSCDRNEIKSIYNLVNTHTQLRAIVTSKRTWNFLFKNNDLECISILYFPE